jgi:hypothetical protein
MSRRIDRSDAKLTTVERASLERAAVHQQRALTHLERLQGLCARLGQVRREIEDRAARRALLNLRDDVSDLLLDLTDSLTKGEAILTALVAEGEPPKTAAKVHS